MLISGVDITQVDATPLFVPGSIFSAEDGKKYKYMVYSEEAAAVDGVAGEVAYYVAADTTGYTVTSDLSASDEVGAGVIQATISEGEYGWFQISGVATLSIALTAATDGAPYTPTGSADGTLDVATGATDAICAQGLDTSAKIILCMFPQ